MSEQLRKPDGWRSRRHETRDAQDAAREAYRTRAERRPRQIWDPSSKQWIKTEEVGA